MRLLCLTCKNTKTCSPDEMPEKLLMICIFIVTSIRQGFCILHVRDFATHITKQWWTCFYIMGKKSERMNKLIFMKRKHASSSFFYFQYRYVVMKNIMALFTMYLTVPYMLPWNQSQNLTPCIAGILKGFRSQYM